MYQSRDHNARHSYTSICSHNRFQRFLPDSLFNEKNKRKLYCNAFDLHLWITQELAQTYGPSVLFHFMKEIMYALKNLGFQSDFLEKCRFCSIDQFFTTGAEIRLPSDSIVTLHTTLPIHSSDRLEASLILF